MKKLFLFGALIFAVVTFMACNQSKRGAWSEADKTKARTELSASETGMDELGEQKEVYLDCYLNKLEMTYSSYSEANRDYPGCEKIALECAEEILGYTEDE